MGLANQSCVPDEIVVVDSGSTDATLDIASQFPVTILSLPKEQFSFGRSLNFGLEHSSCDVAVIASAHVYPLYENWIAELVAPFSDNSVALVYGHQQGDELTKFSEHQILRNWFPDVSVAVQEHPFCNNANAAVRRDIWENLKYDETLTGLEDLDWAKRAIKQGFHLAYAAQATIVHVHDETWIQILNRYRREAIAHKQIYGDQTMGALEAVGLAALNSLDDYYCAFKSGVLGQNWRSIPEFRLAQFIGTYQGFRQRGPVSATLKRRFYYPSAFVASAPPAVRPVAQAPTAYQRLDQNAENGSFVLDITVPLEDGIPTWPGSCGYCRTATMSLAAGDASNVSKIEMDVHCGTHIDAPLHCIADGLPVNKLDLGPFMGPSNVVDFGEAPAITADLLSKMVPQGTQRLLCRTSNSGHWQEDFREDFVALTRNGAQWIVDNEVKLIANDYLSIQRYSDNSETHRILMEGGVTIVEGVNLKDVTPGAYTLICLPMRLVDAEGAPARAVLLPPGMLDSL